MEKMLRQILDGQQEMRQEIRALQQGQQKMQQEIADLRDSTFKAFDTLNKEIGAMRDTQAVAMDKWNKSTDILERVETLLDEREAERVAIDATLIGHEERITTLEKRVS